MGDQKIPKICTFSHFEISFSQITKFSQRKKKVIGRKYCTLSFWQLFFHVDENFEFFSFLVTSQIQKENSIFFKKLPNSTVICRRQQKIYNNAIILFFSTLIFSNHHIWLNCLMDNCHGSYTQSFLLKNLGCNCHVPTYQIYFFHGEISLFFNKEIGKILPNFAILV